MGASKEPIRLRKRKTPAGNISLYLDSDTNKRITFLDDNKKEQHNKITSIDEIYNYADTLIAAAKYK